MEKAATISTKRVEEILIGCLFDEDRLVDGVLPKGEKYIKVEGLQRCFAFDPEKVEKFREEIEGYLNLLDDNFKEDKGGGYSFLGAPFLNTGEQWGEQVDADRLLTLGMAIGKVRYLFEDRVIWSVLPGSVPYYIILNEPINMITEFEGID